ncbi:sarcocystatin-A-like [Musca vetustissima]|uniref:sarcocystatin-A-like n=1 Tax=Musca vetustissima TaxID=27455 RepID=UPI002AB79966|nr:sarcocystatin-A-like [Musca vetustissima]XP_061395043.1 sarcocystatin-A-like [Musca vetustissima]
MFPTKCLLFLGFVLVVTMCVESQIMTGGVQPVKDLSEVERQLSTSLSRLENGDGPHYKLRKVHKATRQVVAGSLTRIDADLEDSNGKVKPCKVSIWSRPWLPNGIEVTFECDDEPKVVRKHNA